MTEPARTPEARKKDVLKHLAEDVDVWVSTAATDGTPYLMPLSFLWTDDTVLLSTALNNPTSRNLQANPTVHLAFGGTRDVVLVIGTAEVIKSSDLPTEVGDAFASQAGFDPRALKSTYLYFRVRPVQIQAWREVNELNGRDLMREGSWLV